MEAREKLSAYLARIGLDGITGADVETLMAVQRAHRLAIAFENLDIPLGRGIDLAPDSVFDKLVTKRRGGYCFEQNALLLWALRAIGFQARPLLARVWLRLRTDETPPRTHSLNLVQVEGADYIADAGFGGSYTPPMRLRDGEAAETSDGARHRLARDGEEGWMLERNGGAGWVRQYGFTTDTVWPADLEMANHWTACRPGTRFTTLRIASRALPDGYASLIDRTLTISRRNRAEEREIGDAGDYRRTLEALFGLDLTEEVVARLGLF